jgi:hopene-associated glycosyltransferase HpnB
VLHDVLLALAAAGGVSALAWLAVLLLLGRPWDLRPVAEDETPPPDPESWPSVAVLIPARNESGALPRTLPALLAQDYPGPWRAVLVDDRSEDGTGELARRLAGADVRLAVVRGGPLPERWAGKVWALEQAAAACAAGPPAYFLLTDADIRHEPGSLRRLVAESEAGRVGLNSRMARLHCRSRSERLLIPPFLFFFNLLYPMRRVNDARSGVAAAAGGCVLVRREALERAGGFASIRGEIIDDVHLARRIKDLGEPIRLSVSRFDVVSLREYGDVGGVWRMVRRTAFDELRYSWALLAVTLAVLALLFPLPPLLALGGAALAAGALDVSSAWAAGLGLAGLAAWGLMTAALRPTVRFFGLAVGWALTLPLGGTLYGAMTFDSARRHLLGRRAEW